jgi:hypothetical protein
MANRFRGSSGLSHSHTLFKETKCTIDTNVDHGNDGVNVYDMKALDEEKIRCHILDCLVALRRVQKKKKTININSGDGDYESAKNRVFEAAISMIMVDEQSVADDRILTSLLASLPDDEKMTDGRSWMPLHFAIVLGDKIKDDDVHRLHSYDPLAMRQYSLNKSFSFDWAGFLPSHFLCMQTHPNMIDEYLEILVHCEI